MRLIACLAAICLLLCACGSEPMLELAFDGGVICRAWGNAEGLRRLEVTGADGAVERFSLSGAAIEPDPAGGAERIDLNFDGHDDLRILQRVDARGERRYFCFLWTERGMTRSGALEKLRSPEPDAETGTITAWEYAVLAEEQERRARVSYVWQEVAGQASLAPVAKTELTWYIEDEIYCLSVYAAEAGHPLALVSEKWIFPENFREEEIWN